MKSFIQPIVDDVTSGKKTARQYVEEALSKLRDVNGEYNIAISETAERALQRADEIDQSVLQGGAPGRLAGVPFIAKDNFLTFASTTTAASNVLKDFEAPYQATAINKLESEGAICIAKANHDAFGHGSSTEHSDFGPTKNPHDTSRVPGGSSGGSAAAVALGVVPFSIATDTGGSVRQPASYCGVIGHKPTYGMVSRFGVVAMASSTDTIGPIAKTAFDTGLIMDIVAGKDERDATTIDRPEEAMVPSPQKSLKIGLVTEYMTDDVEEGVRKRILDTADKMKALGHVVEEVSIPSLPLALAVYYIVVPAEISSNLSRYDGIKYGYSEQQATSLEEVYGLSRDKGFNAENKRRILIGTYVLSSGYYDAYYRKAQTVRTILRNDFNKVFAEYDVLLGPVAPTTAFKFGENETPMQMYLTDIMTVSASLTGSPAISVPAGESNDMPVGAQLIGKQKSDALLISLAAQLEGED